MRTALLLASTLALLVGPLLARPSTARAAPPAPALSAAPEGGGLDRDLQAVLDEARRLLDAGDAKAAAALVLALAASADRFAVAQRPTYAPRAAGLLVDASAQLAAHEDLQGAAVAADAAAALDEAQRPAAARALVALAEARRSERVGEALGLARRARALDATNAAAASLDEALSANPLLWPAAGVAAAGVAAGAATAVGLIVLINAEGQDETLRQLAGVGVWTLAPAVAGLGILGAQSVLELGLVGRDPVLPDALPAVELPR